MPELLHTCTLHYTQCRKFREQTKCIVVHLYNVMSVVHFTFTFFLLVAQTTNVLYITCIINQELDRVTGAVSHMDQF